MNKYGTKLYTSTKDDRLYLENCKRLLTKLPRGSVITGYQLVDKKNLIQGGCSDAMRDAMIGCYELLKNTQSRMVLQVHDELLFEIHKSEMHLVPQLQEIMKAAYPHRLLPMDVDVEYSDKSWQDMGSLEELVA